MLQNSGCVVRRQKRGHHHLVALHLREGECGNDLEFAEPSIKEVHGLQRCRLPNHRLPRVRATMRSPALPILAPHLDYQPCLPRCPSPTKLGRPPPPCLTLALPSSRSLLAHPDDAGDPPKAGSPEHPLHTLLVAHVCVPQMPVPSLPFPHQNLRFSNTGTVCRCLFQHPA